jgi:threonine/homoserine/homoserine lactone efflux protein
VACLTWAAWVVWAAWACNCPLLQRSERTFDFAQKTLQEIAGFFFVALNSDNSIERRTDKK